ncbi:hypothetical protein ERO13_A03G019050v2 [Gossypium hirsutum]|uniref:Secreted protein n=1 Tax=Gossypium darwinii TaxID=34276 RepID=A0A5D2H0I5_GOSDA|nr:hypothetical protein ERO13_A03G019050v2 [Gossypium hirsutum]TYH23657.1 hypothetical protein ES288_A03G031200v1 [Gossypium darwinii]
MLLLVSAWCFFLSAQKCLPHTTTILPQAGGLLHLPRSLLPPLLLIKSLSTKTWLLATSHEDAEEDVPPRSATP